MNFNLPDLKPDTDQERRFIKKLISMFEKEDQKIKNQTNKKMDELLEVFNNKLVEDKKINMEPIKNFNTEKSFVELFDFEEKNNVRLPIVSYFEAMMNDSTLPKEIRDFKEYYFELKQKYIELEESEDINNF
jgi:uncharacterized protein (UPF0147 family)